MSGLSSSWGVLAILVGGQLALSSEAGPFSLAPLIAAGVGRDRDATGPREIGTGKQLFLGEEMLASFDRVQFTLNPAKRAERVLTATEPWEEAGLGFCSYLEDGNRFQMWYHGWCYDENIEGNWMSRICYCESADGLHWTKPDLGQYEFGGSKHNNILAVGLCGYAHGHTVFVDPNAANPTEKYKMIFGDFYRVRVPGCPASSVSGAVSPDGVRWKSVETKCGVIMPAGTDTQNAAFYDPYRKKYVAYVRHNCYQKDARGQRVGAACRGIARSESADFRRFPRPELVAAPDEKDPGSFGGGLYNSAAMVYPFAPNVYLFFPSFMEPDTALNVVQFAASRDGVHVDRRFRQPYVPVNPNAVRLGDQIAYMAYMGTGMIRVGDELWQYCLEMDVPHDGAWYGRRIPGGIRRYVQRLDGFVSLDARKALGTATTKPFVLRGAGLELNANAALASAVPNDESPRKSEASAARSSLLVEVLGLGGEMLATSEPIYGDGVALTPSWKGRRDLGDLIGKAVQLRFTLRMAKLYAFQVVDI